MTHPDTLTIPRAVVEQALALCESLQRYDGTLTGAQVISTADALRAALQPQAAAWQTLSQQIQESAIASGQKQRPRENNQGIASDAWLHPIGTCSPERDGENQHHEHRAGESDAKCADCECDSECTRVSGGGQVRTEQVAQAAAKPHTFNDESPFCVKCGSTGEDAEGPVAHILPRDLKILKFKSMPVPVDPLPYDNGEEKTVPLYTTPPATQAALTAALEALKAQPRVTREVWKDGIDIDVAVPHTKLRDAAIVQLEALGE